MSNNGTRLSEDWYPSQELFDWAREHRPDLDINEQVESFIDYWVCIPGAKGYKLNWDRTFKNWIRNAWQKRRASNEGTQTLDNWCDNHLENYHRRH